MAHPNRALIDRCFAAYGERGLTALRDLPAEDATWTLSGHHPLCGTKESIDAIVAFFDAIGSVMGRSKPMVEKLVLGGNEQCVVER